MNSPTEENPDGYHRLIGGSVEMGETHREAIVREIDGSIVPVVWRPIDDAHEDLPLYPAEAVPWVRSLIDRS